MSIILPIKRVRKAGLVRSRLTVVLRVEDDLLVILEVEGVDRLVLGTGVDDVGLQDVGEGCGYPLRMASDLIGQLPDLPGPDPHQPIHASTDDVVLVNIDRRDRSVVCVDHVPEQGRVGVLRDLEGSDEAVRPPGHHGLVLGDAAAGALYAGLLPDPGGAPGDDGEVLGLPDPHDASGRDRGKDIVIVLLEGDVLDPTAVALGVEGRREVVGVDPVDIPA